ncbi:MAG: response regulator [Burkholderiales bacterium]|nr:response regulator [Burkholderiales bacterium]
MERDRDLPDMPDLRDRRDLRDLADLPDDLGDGERANILIVDDLSEKLVTLGAVLEELGQNLVFVRSGRDALREVLRRDFAVILLDVNMPEIDGLETAELIRSHRRSAHTPIIFITAFADELQTARGYSLGAVDYILSPVVPQVLRSKVSVFVALHAMRAQVKRRAEDRAARLAAEAAQVVAERNDRRSAFLSGASRLLSRSLDAEVGMRQLAELVLQAGCAQATVALADENENLERVCRASAAGDGGAESVKWLAASDLADEERQAVQRAMQQRCTVNAPGWSAVPMLLNQRLHGVLLASVQASAPPQAQPDASLIEELVARAATALDNAWLYRSLQLQIEERAGVERELQAANRRKDHFLAMLSHELRNPLAAACSALQVLDALVPEDPRLTRATAIMGRQLQQMTLLMDELLDVSRISRNKIVLARRRVDLNLIIANSLESLQPMLRARRQTVRMRLPPEPVWMNGDPARLTQIMSNLIHNASKYSASGQAIEVHCSVDEVGALIRVRDQGIGIDAAVLPRIFEMFEQGATGIDRAQGGLGVGLTLALRLAQLHGGHIEASSEGVGCGAEFRVRLPCVWLAHSEAGSPAPVATGEAAPAGTRLRLLVVDDNRDAAESLAELLRVAGHEVHVALDGQAGLVAARRLRPDAMLIDIGLPLIDGYELARGLRGQPQTQQLALVALTGYGQREDREAALRAGFDEHFVKPADVGALLRSVEEIRAGRASVSTAARQSRGRHGR